MLGRCFFNHEVGPAGSRLILWNPEIGNDDTFVELVQAAPEAFTTLKSTIAAEPVERRHMSEAYWNHSKDRKIILGCIVENHTRHKTHLQK